MRGLLPAAGLAVFLHVVLFTMEFPWEREKKSTSSKNFPVKLDLNYKQKKKEPTPELKPKSVEAPLPIPKEKIADVARKRKTLQKTPKNERPKNITRAKTSSPREQKTHAFVKSSQPQEKYREMYKNISKDSGPEDPPCAGTPGSLHRDLEGNSAPATNQGLKAEPALDAIRIPDEEEGQLAIFGSVKKAPDPNPTLIREAIPAYKQNPPPKYPRIARKRGYEGKVILQVLVDQNGKVKELRIVQSSGHDVLDRAAMTSVKNWQFKPGMKGDRKVDTWVKVPVRFQLK